MFETLFEIPEPIRNYYEEVYESELTGEMIEEPYTYEDDEGSMQTGTKLVPEYHDVLYIRLKSFGETQDQVVKVLEMNKPLEIVNKFLGFVNNKIHQDFHTFYYDWYCSKPGELDPKYFDEEGLFLVEQYNEDLANHSSNEPILPEPKTLEDYSNYNKWKKLQGVEFNGVMCSATGEDMHGLTSIFVAISSMGYVGTNFRFDNGNSVWIGQDNLAEFQAVWFPFRNSFEY